MSDIKGDLAAQPLAARQRPQSLAQYVGQSHLLAPGKALREVIEKGHLHSMIFWGPPGVGKTTLARMLAEHVNVHFIAISAVFAGVKDIRASMDEARAMRDQWQKKTLLFVDEVHRFNKSQQDAFLPYIEDGTVIFVGATTENPSFELNNAILSRCRVYVLQSLTADDLQQVINNALQRDDVLKKQHLSIQPEALGIIARAAQGDARMALNLLEMAADIAEPAPGNTLVITEKTLAHILQGNIHRFDKGGEIFHDQISALHKAVRGSSPDAALYWCLRMLDGGCDPLYVARRVVRMASEDIGNADPRALEIALNAWDVVERLGSPEAELTLAQAVIYMASAPKSNAVYAAFNQARKLVADAPAYDVPMHIRNAPTGLMKDLGYGDDYRYAHDYEEAFVAGDCYLPPELQDVRFYQPTPRGLEQKIGEKLRHLEQLNRSSTWQRYARTPAGKKVSGTGKGNKT
ncbi:MAG TPA: replication-associated recombination protein A [Pseudomonadales bacterium]|nr:replication-associated recombination protein A [Pseudomonadales bacterium]